MLYNPPNHGQVDVSIENLPHCASGWTQKEPQKGLKDTRKWDLGYYFNKTTDHVYVLMLDGKLFAIIADVDDDITWFCQHR